MARISQQQKNLISSIEGIGDLLVHKAQYKKKETKIKYYLDRLENIIFSIFDLEESDPERYKRLIFSDDFLNTYGGDIENAGFLIQSKPDQFIPIINTAIEQVLRIHDVAVDSKNTEVSRLATYRIISILNRLSKKNNKDALLARLLDALYETLQTSIKYKDISMYAAASHWYTRILFTFGDEEQFKIEYLYLFNRMLARSIHYVISINEFELFKRFISHIFDHGLLNIYSYRSVYDIETILIRAKHLDYISTQYGENIHKQFSKLDENYKNCIDLDEINNWVEEVGGLIDSIKDKLVPAEKIEVDKAYTDLVNNLIEKYKYHKLQEIIIDICAYCIFKERYEYIVYMWDYVQPHDADATYLGSDFFPNHLEDLILLYYKNKLFHVSGSWEDHHGKEYYYDKIFVYSLARMLKDSRLEYKKHALNENKVSKPAFTCSCPKINPAGLFAISNKFNELHAVLDKMFENRNEWSSLGFDMENLSDFYYPKLMECIKDIKHSADNQLERIYQRKPHDDGRVKEFIENFIDRYTRSAIFRKFFDDNDVFIDNAMSEEELEPKLFLSSVVDDKAAFFEEWYSSYYNWGEGYGTNYGISENKEIFSRLCDAACKTELAAIDQNIENIGIENAIIIAPYHLASSLIWSGLVDETRLQKFDVKNNKEYELGDYILNDKNIPIMGFDCGRNIKKLILLSKENLPIMRQFRPFWDINDASITTVNNITFELRFFSEDSQILKEFINKPPGWLKNEGEIQDMQKFLYKRVLIRITESFNIEPQDKLKMFCFEMNE